MYMCLCTAIMEVSDCYLKIQNPSSLCSINNKLEDANFQSGLWVSGETWGPTVKSPWNPICVTSYLSTVYGQAVEGTSQESCCISFRIFYLTLSRWLQIRWEEEKYERWQKNPNTLSTPREDDTEYVSLAGQTKQNPVMNTITWLDNNNTIWKQQ